MIHASEFSSSSFPLIFRGGVSSRNRLWTGTGIARQLLFQPWSTMPYDDLELLCTMYSSVVHGNFVYSSSSQVGNRNRVLPARPVPRFVWDLMSCSDGSDRRLASINAFSSSFSATARSPVVSAMPRLLSWLAIAPWISCSF